ncbi:peptide/nickel transport system ATP-binding protein [Kribbella amoyensis]|uniref:Peptide/nickel transport system ATP-binding protein n=1 Tax=Kribbella amoyensis TaxID=996641 RepID=A0A561B2U4_9ACTN|nr:ATP-binding cassette domain-containing protein [Kribbella amoyensis]TWD73164.1 peptide/nickel transport system ATP-binding protein [Kribbella amoyensis]
MTAPTSAGDPPARGAARTEPARGAARTEPARGLSIRMTTPTPDRTAPEPLIRVTEVTRDYPRPRTSLLKRAPVVHALRGVSLDVRPGERFGIVGESGCGKSTLLRIIAGLDRPTAGQVVVDGQEISRLPERRLRFLREELQLVFQDPMSSLDPRMRVRDIIAEPLVVQGHPASGARVRELLDAVGLPADSGDRYPHQFSGGQRQRISLARALAPSPKILVADEPVSALDVSVRAQVLNLISDLVDDLELTLVFVSHDLSVVKHVCDTVAVMHAGRIVETGTTGEVYATPQHPYTRRLVAAIPTLPRALAGATTRDLLKGALE